LRGAKWCRSSLAIVPQIGQASEGILPNSGIVSALLSSTSLLGIHDRDSPSRWHRMQRRL
jgi:hypothetical protein